MDSEPVRLHVGVATIPRRKAVFPRVLASLLNQTFKPHKIFVALNNYEAVPREFPKDPCIAYRLTGKHNLGDVEKFFPLEQQDRGEYAASVDDDMLYPKDYFECLIRWSRQFGDRAAVGVYGRVFQWLPCNHYYDNRMYSFRRRLGRPVQVGVIGTATFLVRSALLPGFQRPWDRLFINRGDILIAVELSQQRVPKIIVPRGDWWLRDTEAQFRSTTHRNEARAHYLEGTTKLVNKHAALLRKDLGVAAPDGVVKLGHIGNGRKTTPSGLRVR